MFKNNFIQILDVNDRSVWIDYTKIICLHKDEGNPNQIRIFLEGKQIWLDISIDSFFDIINKHEHNLKFNKSLEEIIS